MSVSIPRAWAGQTVLVTGANGFLGSLLLEQLLRTVPDIRRIYVLVSGPAAAARTLEHPRCCLHAPRPTPPRPAAPRNAQVRNSGVHSAQARVDKLTAGGLFRLVPDEALAKIKASVRWWSVGAGASHGLLDRQLTLDLARSPGPAPRWCPAT
jgi:hypothetical protein